jgi:rRNA-processing protein FCF1
MRYVIDTCIVNKLVDGRLALSDLPTDGDYFVSHVQHDEITVTRDSARRTALLAKFDAIVDATVPTESVVLGVSKIGMCKLSDGRLFSQLVAGLDVLNGGKRNNVQDALIAEVAIENGYVFVTTDYHLQDVARAHGCAVLYLRT